MKIFLMRYKRKNVMSCVSKCKTKKCVEKYKPKKN